MAAATIFHFVGSCHFPIGVAFSENSNQPLPNDVPFVIGCESSLDKPRQLFVITNERATHPQQHVRLDNRLFHSLFNNREIVEGSYRHNFIINDS